MGDFALLDINMDDELKSRIIPQEELDKRHKDGQKAWKDRIEKKKNESKELHELVENEFFEIESIMNVNYRINKEIPAEQILLGGVNPQEYEDTVVRTILNVKPFNNYKCPIKQLNFFGYSFRKKGEIILAKIPKYETKEEVNPNWGISCQDDYLYFHFPRKEYETKEDVIEISLLENITSKGIMDLRQNYSNFVVSKDRSMNSKEYFKD